MEQCPQCPTVGFKSRQGERLRPEHRPSPQYSSAEVLLPGAEVDFVALAGEERGWMGWLSSGTQSFRQWSTFKIRDSNELLVAFVGIL